MLAKQRCRPDNVSQFLKVWEDVRKRRSNEVQRTSREQGEVFELVGYGSVAPRVGLPIGWNYKGRAEDGDSGWTELGHELETRLDWVRLL